MKLKVVLLSVFAGLVLSTVPANAALVTYLDEGSWLAAVASVTTADFNDAVTGGGFTKPGFGQSAAVPSAGITVDTILFQTFINATASSSAGFVKDPGGVAVWTAAVYGNLGDYFKDTNPASNSHIRITFPTPVTAWSTVYGLTSGPAAAPLILIDGVSCAICNPATTTFPNALFFGVTSDAPMSYVDLQFPNSANGYMMIDKTSYGTADVGGGAAPEVCTWILCASGLLGLVKLARRVQSGQALSAA
jgi:hypothetical protein